MNSKMVKELLGLLFNLRNGLRSLIFRQASIENYYITIDQSALLVLFYSAITFFGSYYLSLPNPQISIFGLSTIATQVFMMMLAVFLVSRALKRHEAALQLFIVLLSTWPWFYLVWLVIGESSNFSFVQFYGDKKNIYIAYNIWLLAVLIHSTSHLIGFSPKNTVKSLGAYLLVISLPLHFSYMGEFWHLRYEDNEEFAKYRSINIENVYYKQFDFIEDLKRQMLPERPGVSDLYFVGFGSYGSQDVFMKEVQYANNLFDERFDTKGRSAALVNNIKTIDSMPLASATNLRSVINHVGKLINPEEDILFLYLTSHGSKQHELSVELVPLTLNMVDPGFLKESLDSTQIKYRVILVSACFSGGFVEPLKDDYTLIMTAADVDRKSFGCSNESEFTYFGKAVFEEQLNHSRDFIVSFNEAITSIQNREQSEQREPSHPQLFIGDKIREKLKFVRHELEAFYTETQAF